MALFRAIYHVTCVVEIEATDEDEAYDELEQVSQAKILRSIEDIEMVEMVEVE